MSLVVLSPPQPSLCCQTKTSAARIYLATRPELFDWLFRLNGKPRAHFFGRVLKETTDLRRVSRELTVQPKS